jgi:hypothetical protein
MTNQDNLNLREAVQTEFPWAEAPRAESALAQPVIAKASVSEAASIKSSLAEAAVSEAAAEASAAVEPYAVKSATLESAAVEPALPESPEPKVSDASESAARIAESAAPAPATPDASPKRPVSERRLAANRANAQKSTGPRTPDGKRRSALNATRHGMLSQVLHLPEEEMAAYDEFTAPYVSSLSPVGQTETELAHACADLQFRLHRLSAAEHNLFALGHEEHGDRYDTGHPESHAAMTFVETLCCSKDPLATLSLYEQRLSRRFLQTLNKLHQMQKERRALEQEQLKQLYMMSLHHPEPETLEPAEFGFVCSSAEWKMFYKRIQMLTPPSKSPNGNAGYKNRSQNSRQLTRRAA